MEPSDEARRILETTELRGFTRAALTDVDAITERLTHIREDGYSIPTSSASLPGSATKPDAWWPR